MQGEDRVRLWLARRRLDGDGEHVTLVYTTPDGGHVLNKEPRRDEDVALSPMATIEVAPSRLSTVDDPDERVALSTRARETRKRYASDDQI